MRKAEMELYQQALERVRVLEDQIEALNRYQPKTPHLTKEDLVCDSCHGPIPGYRYMSRTVKVCATCEAQITGVPALESR